jgi:hypothetical protein
MSHLAPQVARRVVRVTALTLVVLLLAAVVAPVAAQTGGSDPALDELLVEAVDGVNAGGGYDAPGYVAGAVAGPTNLHVHDDGTVHRYSFVVTEDLTVEEFRAGERDDAVTLLTTDRSVLEAVSADDDPAGALAAAFAAGDVRVEGVGILNGLKWGLLNALRWAFGVVVLAPV